MSSPGIDFFTPTSGFIGGGLIGLSAATLLVLQGDVLGASGLASSVVLHPIKSLTDPTVGWKVILLSIFLLFSNLVMAPYFTNDERLGQDPSIPVVSTYGYLLGGFFVGFGTRLGNGCTTGHGICGMARLSVRSIVAVCTFMMSAFATASIVAPDNKLFASGTAWLRTDTVPVLHDQWRGFGVSMFIVIPSFYVLYNVLKVGKSAATSGVETSLVNEGKQLEENRTRHTSSSHSSTPEDIETAEMTVVPSDGAGSSSTDNDDAPAAAVADGPTTEYGTTPAAQATECTSEEQCCENTQSSTVPKALSNQEKIDSLKRLLPSTLASMLFSVGLAVSQMVLPSKVLGFLNLFTISKGTYDPTLLTVMIGGCIVSMISYQFVGSFSLIPTSWTWMPRLTKPLQTSKFCIPTNKTIDVTLVCGAMCFGIGWAIAGLCPGPAIFLFASGAVPVIRYWWPAFLVGSLIAGCIKERKTSP